MKLRAATALLIAGMVNATAFAQSADCPIRITWTRIGELRQAVGGPAFGAVADLLIIAGGTSWRDPDHKIWSGEACTYDTARGEWGTLPPLPHGIGYPCAVSYHAALFVFGGQLAKDTNCSDAWTLGRNGDAWTWNKFAALPEKLANMQAALVGSVAYLVAADSGEKLPSPDNKVWKIDLAEEEPSWKRCAPLPGPMRTGVATTACDGLLYAFGGGIRESFVYDPTGDTWKKIQDLPYPAQWSWAVSSQDRYILIPGGFVAKEQAGSAPSSVHVDAEGFIADVLVYDIKRGTYSFSDPLPKGIIDYGVACVGNRIYLAGGEDKQKHRESWLLMGLLSLR